MSDPIREAYDARRLLMQRLNAILDDRWPLAGKIMAAVDEYAEACSTPAEALRKAHAFIGSITPDEWALIDKAREAKEHLDALSSHNREADHE